MSMKNDTPAVLILGGDANTTSLVRSFGRRQIRTFVSAIPSCPALDSKFCSQAFPIPDNYDHSEFWSSLLLSGVNNNFKGSLIMSCSDVAVKFVAENYDALKRDYILSDSIPELQLAMLDKQQTIELGKQVGCSIPEYWHIQTIDDVVKIQDQVLYPVMIKPIHSHLFQKKFNFKKYLLANNADELISMANKVFHKKLEFMVCEFIPGPDSELSSYHTYIDDKGNHLFRYTHKIIRRLPKNEGGVCCNVTEWLPETATMGQRFFDGIGFRGMGHIEFKRDARDGQLKIIECNPRFSACQALVLKSGLDMGYLIYCHLTGIPLPEKRSFKNGVMRWDPVSDLLAFRELKRAGEITFVEWLQSVAVYPIAFPYFDLFDLRPFLNKTSSLLSEIISHRFGNNLSHTAKEDHRESQSKY